MVKVFSYSKTFAHPLQLLQNSYNTGNHWVNRKQSNPRTGDNMAETDDVVELTDAVPPADEDVLELTELAESSEKTDQTADLMATSEDFQSEPESEDEVLELSDVIKTLPPEDKDVSDLTEETHGSDKDELLELTEVVDESTEDEEIIDLTEEAAAAEEDEIIDLTETISLDQVESETEAPDVSEYEDTIALDDEVPIALTRQAEPAEDQEIVELTEAVAAPEIAPQDESRPVPESAETIELDQGTLEELSQAAVPAGQDEVVDLTDEAEQNTVESKPAGPASSVFFETMEMDQSAIGDFPQSDETKEDEILDLTDEIESAPAEAVPALEDYEDTINLDQQEFANAGSQDELAADADETGESEERTDEMKAPFDYEDTISMDQNDIPGFAPEEEPQAGEEVLETESAMDASPEAEPATPLSKSYEEDKELLELIDDIQSTLDTEPKQADVDAEVGLFEEEAAGDADDVDQKAAQSYELMDDNAVFADPDLPDTESELYDNLGIDLTSEIERKAFEEAQEAAIEDVRPPEVVDAVPEEKPIPSDAIISAVKAALTDLLTEEDNPLTRAIEKAVRNAMGHD